MPISKDTDIELRLALTTAPVYFVKTLFRFSRIVEQVANTELMLLTQRAFTEHTASGRYSYKWGAHSSSSLGTGSPM
ncbi:hypothetical protein D3C72_1986890 [compost metagenome]